MRNPRFWLFMVPWAGGVLTSVVRVSDFGVWLGLLIVFGILIGSLRLFHHILARYWTRKNG